MKSIAERFREFILNHPMPQYARQVINIDIKNWLQEQPENHIADTSKKMFTLEEVEAMCKEMFEVARKETKFFTLEEVEQIARDATYQAIGTDAHFQNWWAKKKQELEK